VHPGWGRENRKPFFTVYVHVVDLMRKDVHY